MRFDRVIVVDWSAANLPTSATNRANSIWVGCHDAEGGIEWHHRTRAAAEAQIVTLTEIDVRPRAVQIEESTDAIRDTG